MKAKQIQREKSCLWVHVVREGFLEEGDFNNTVKQWFSTRVEIN